MTEWWGETTTQSPVEKTQVDSGPVVKIITLIIFAAVMPLAMHSLMLLAWWSWHLVG